jgi:hypothetical protein
MAWSAPRQKVGCVMSRPVSTSPTVTPLPPVSRSLSVNPIRASVHSIRRGGGRGVLPPFGHRAVAEIGRGSGVVGLDVGDGVQEDLVEDLAQLAEGRARDGRAAVAVRGVVDARPFPVLADAMGHVEGFRDHAGVVAEDLGQPVRDQVGLRRVPARVGEWFGTVTVGLIP